MFNQYCRLYLYCFEHSIRVFFGGKELGVEMPGLFVIFFNISSTTPPENNQAIRSTKLLQPIIKL